MREHGNYSIKRSSAVILQIVIGLIGIVTLTLMFLGPHVEGRNANASLFQIYFNDPFLAYVYIGSVPFFVALLHARKLLGYIEQDAIFSQAAVNALKTIKFCAFITAGAIVGAGVYVRIAASGSNDDSAGAATLGIIAAFIAIVIGTAAAVFRKTLQSVVRYKIRS